MYIGSFSQTAANLSFWSLFSAHNPGPMHTTFLTDFDRPGPSCLFAASTLFLLPGMFFSSSRSHLINLQEPHQLSPALGTPPRSWQREAAPGTAAEPLIAAHPRASDSVTQLCNCVPSLPSTDSSTNSGLRSVSPQGLVQLLALSRLSFKYLQSKRF